jgi:hypothetical protein
MDELHDWLGRSPEIFPHSLDVRNDSISFIHLDKSDFERASFLDERVLTPHTPRRSMPWTQAAATVDAAELTERCGFIFHIGHVGSTLLSRLIGAHPGMFALREPLVLRTFAQLNGEPGARPPAWRDQDFNGRLSGCLKLLSRTFDATETAVIKATSFVSEIAASLLLRPSAPKAVLMYVSPESYLATILGGPNSRQEAKMLTPSRLQRLHRRIGAEAWRAASLSEGEALALGWACEMSALAEAARTGGKRIFRLDFDDFLAAPENPLLSALGHFGIVASVADVRVILEGPDMRRYSKAPEYAYDRALRLDVLDAARTAHASEISRGLAWLHRAAEQHTAVQHALELAE